MAQRRSADQYFDKANNTASTSNKTSQADSYSNSTITPETDLSRLRTRLSRHPPSSPQPNPHSPPAVSSSASRSLRSREPAHPSASSPSSASSSPSSASSSPHTSSFPAAKSGSADTATSRREIRAATSSNRLTRSATRQTRHATGIDKNSTTEAESNSTSVPSASLSTPTSQHKRKASDRASLLNSDPKLSAASTSSTRRATKRQRVASPSFSSPAETPPRRTRHGLDMAENNPTPKPGAPKISPTSDTSLRRKSPRQRQSEHSSPQTPRSSTRRKSSSAKGGDQEMPDVPFTSLGSPSSRKQQKGLQIPGEEPTSERNVNETPRHNSETFAEEDEDDEGDEGDDDDDDDDEDRDEDEDDEDEDDGEDEGDDDEGDDNEDNDGDDDNDMDDDEQERHHFLSRLAAGGAFQASRLFGGLMSGSGTSSRLREMLEGLKSGDPSTQMVALQDLSSFLLISTEDNLAGHFSPDSFVRELVKIMQPNEITGEVNDEMELMACRCIANLMEALPQATASVVYGGAIPVICGKLLMINSIEVAEQALTTLEKISVEFPGHIVKEGGLSACLGFLDFFPTGTQRSAVTTVANSCRNIPDECFQTVKDVMPILENTLSNADQTVVKQASLSVSRIAESFRHKGDKLEQLISENLLRSLLRLLMPGSTSMIPADIHTKFLRVIAFTARASPSHSAALISMDVVDTLYQILTGVSPPDSQEDVASHIDGVVIMQSLIRIQREQIYETLNVICELLPGLAPGNSLIDDFLQSDAAYPSAELISRTDLMPKPKDAARRDLLSQHKVQLRRFAMVLLPTLIHAYTSTVNLGVRQKVLASQLKMLSNFDVDILEAALKTVPFASHLASILSQQDHPILVLLALQAARLLSQRLSHIYGYQFCREGVLGEIQKIAHRTPQVEIAQRPLSAAPSIESPVEPSSANAEQLVGANDEDSDENEDGNEDNDDDDDDELSEHNNIVSGADAVVQGEDDDEDNDEDQEPHPSSSSPTDSTTSVRIDASGTQRFGLDDLVTKEAKRFLEAFEETQDGITRSQANAVLDSVRTIAKDLQQSYANDDIKSGPTHFRKLVKFFAGDALDSITSAELLGSELVDVLLEVFGAADDGAAIAKQAFLCVFTDDQIEGAYRAGGAAATSTPFNALVRKLQDLLSRAEHFEVITVHTHDSSRGGAASMLAKQLRLKLVADNESDIPRAYRNIMVSIHAIATFKALDDYLRPRLSLGDRPRGLPRGSDLMSTLASAGIPPEARQRLVESGLMGSLAGMPPLLPSMASAAPSESRRRSRRKSNRGGKTTGDSSATETPHDPAVEAMPSLRRTSRTAHAKQPSTGNETPTPSGDTLECADERQISDEETEENDAVTATALAGVSGNEQERRHETPDPDAVNMEVASSGKITARQEDGTRIPTPSQTGGNTPRNPETPSQSRTRGGPSTSGNPSGMSYAAAIRATPQDWHIEFSIDGHVINNETTIYRAVHYRPNQPEEPSSRSLWSNVHPVTYKRVAGPPPEQTTLSPPPESFAEPGIGSMAASLHKNPLTSKILRLLDILHEMNNDMDVMLEDHKESPGTRSEPASLFVNTKLTAKLNRQLEEPLIVASNCLPGWSEDLARLYPFLFPFETRHLFLQSTSFGYSRSMTRWQSSQNESSRHNRHRDERPFLGRLQRQKVRISRTRILESAMKVMELYGASPSILEVEYFEEVGTGLGPTLEFYSTVSKEFSKKKIKLWRENESTSTDEYAFGKHGLFPAPMAESQLDTENGNRILHLYKMMGKFVARAMLDSRIIDINFNPMFFRYNLEGEGASLGSTSSSGPTLMSGLELAAIKQIDIDLYKSLKIINQYVLQKKRIDDDLRLSDSQRAAKLERIEVQGANISDLSLDFTLPGYSMIELVENGNSLAVDIDNVEQYLELVVDATVGKGVRRQIQAFRQGFSQVFPYSALRAFTSAELTMLFGRNEEDWSLETLTDSIKADHGFNMDSRSVRNLLDCMTRFTEGQRRDFLQFVTGSPKLPIGGFKALVPMFTVVCKPAEKPLVSDDYLPSVMTCVNYLKLPDYSSVDVMQGRLAVAIREGQGAFHLS